MGDLPLGDLPFGVFPFGVFVFGDFGLADFGVFGDFPFGVFGAGGFGLLEPLSEPLSDPLSESEPDPDRTARAFAIGDDAPTAFTGSFWRWNAEVATAKYAQIFIISDLKK